MIEEEQTPVGGEATPVGVNAPTFGEASVGLSFNPSNNPQVDEVKKLFAQIIDICDSIRQTEPTYTAHEVPSERANFLTIAIREAQTAQMWAVKGITKQ